MEKFTNLKSLYDYLEENATNFKYAPQIAKLFQELRDSKHRAKKSRDTEKAQWEVGFFHFTLRNGKLHPEFPGTNDKGEVVRVPDLDRFGATGYQYLVERVSSTSNPLLKARYSHILWCSPKKHAKYASTAVDSYLALIKIYVAKDRKELQGHFGLDILNAVKNAYSISYQAKYKTSKVKSVIKELIKRFSFKSSSSFALRANLIRLMLNGRKRFPKRDFIGVEKVCMRISKSLANADNIHGAIDILELGELVDQKIGQETHNWRRRIAECYETLMRQAQKNDNSASLTFCERALENYKKLRDKSKIIELEKEYSELKGSMRLTQVRTEIDLTDHVKRCRKIAERIIKNESPDGILKLLMLDKALLPKYKAVEKRAEKSRKVFVLQHLAPTEVVDQSGHTAQHFADGDEKKYYGILQEYYWELRFNKIHLIDEIFLTGIREDKISSETILSFFNRYSWFGKTISKRVANRKMEYNWLSLIAPAIHEYSLQMQYHLVDPSYLPHLVLSIDSLTLKFEGLIRDICQFSGITTFLMTKDSKGRSIVREKPIDALLREQPFKELFNEDDRLFFKFLFVEKAGYNLRHKVAHALMLFREYNITYMHLLILALLRLGRYDFVQEEDATLGKANKRTSENPPEHGE